MHPGPHGQKPSELTTTPCHINCFLVTHNFFRTKSNQILCMCVYIDRVRLKTPNKNIKLNKLHFLFGATRQRHIWDRRKNHLYMSRMGWDNHTKPPRLDWGQLFTVDTIWNIGETGDIHVVFSSSSIQYFDQLSGARSTQELVEIHNKQSFEEKFWIVSNQSGLC